MARSALAFVLEKHNRYSISALIGAVETDGRFEDIAVHLVKPKLGIYEQVETLAADYERLVVGFSFMTPDVVHVAEVVQHLRDRLECQRLTNVVLIAGGPHPSGAWRQTLKMGFDIVVIGEGEKSLPELLARLNSGSDCEQVKGLAYMKGGRTVFTGRSERVENLDGYPPFAERFGLFSAIEITRGCPWACRFCQTSFLLGGRMRHRSVENVLRWVKVSYERGLKQIRFVTPDAFAYGSDGKNIRPDILSELLDGVNAVVGKENTFLGSFPSEVRPESVTPETIALVLEHAANDNIIIGAQSGSNRMLDISHRCHTVEDIYRAVQITVDAGLIANVDFIFGMPGETQRDRELTIRLIEDLAGMGARVHSHTFLPLAGTPWANAPAGRVDSKTARLLNQLAGKGQQYGQWRKQQKEAAEIVGFRESMPDDDTDTCATEEGSDTESVGAAKT